MRTLPASQIKLWHLPNAPGTLLLFAPGTMYILFLLLGIFVSHFFHAFRLDCLFFMNQVSPQHLGSNLISRADLGSSIGLVTIH